MCIMKKQYRYNVRMAWLLLISLFTGLAGCEKKSIAFGENLAESYTNIIVIDTLTPVISTVRSDSFLTSNTSTALVGNYKDEIFGSINARSFFQLSIPTVIDIPKDAIFDSLTLRLLLTKQYYGDTSIPQQISVHELSAKLEYSEESSGFYNTSSIPYEAIPLGTKEFNPKPNKNDSVEIRLSDTRGQEFLARLKDKTAELTDQTLFLQYFKGLAITTSAAPSSIIAYSTTDSTLKMRLYYTERGVVFSQKFVDFNLINPELQFNQVAIDRNNSILSGVPKNAEIPSAQLGHASYLQSATGVFTKIKFPSLPDLLQVKKTGKILKAQLIIKPLAGSFSSIYRLPPELNLFTTDKSNIFGSALTDNATGTAVTQNGNLYIDALYGENTNYTYDITSYLQQQIIVSPGLLNGLLLYPPSASAANTFNRLVIGDNTTVKSRISVKIFFLAVD